MEVARKVVVGEAGEGESAETSVVLQCTSVGEVEDGEEVVRGEPVRGGEMYAARLGELTAALQDYSKMARRVMDEEEVGDVVSESEGVFRGGRIDFTNESAYWSSRVWTRRCRAPKSYSDDGEAFVVNRASMKRKHEEAKECDPVSQSVVYKDTNSDDSASSSDSEASDSEYEHWNRRATSSKRRRGGGEMYGRILRSDLSLHLRSQQETVNFDKELKEMQHLLELQLQASERREAGMKQRMETLMDLMSKHMGHVEKRVCNLDAGTRPQDQILERINLKLERVMEGFTTLNENLSILSTCLSRGLDSQ